LVASKLATRHGSQELVTKNLQSFPWTLRNRTCKTQAKAAPMALQCIALPAICPSTCEFEKDRTPCHEMCAERSKSSKQASMSESETQVTSSMWAGKPIRRNFSRPAIFHWTVVDLF